MIEYIRIVDAHEQLTDFLDTLEDKGYKKSTIREFKVSIKHFIRYFTDDKNQLFAFDTIDRFMLIYDYKSRTANNFNRNSCVKFYNFVYYNDIYYVSKSLNCILPTYLMDILNQFINEYNFNNCKDTKSRKYKAIYEFLIWLTVTSKSSIKELNYDILLLYIDDLILEKRQYLKSFLLFLYINNYIDHNFSFSINIYKRKIKLPSVYEEGEIVDLINQIDISTNKGIRDKAILLLAARTGLRSCDIVNLKFENINFITHELTITQIKTQQPLTLVLTKELLFLLDKYFYEIRPQINSKYLFLNFNAPNSRMNTSSIRIIVTDYFKKASINIINKKHGPHSLRSTLATAMINDSIPYEVIQKTLGHKNPESLKAYIKMDIENLRKCALPCKAPTKMFLHWLNEVEA